MSHQFKPGDLAIIVGIRFPGCEPNLGKVITVIGFSSLSPAEVWVSGDLVNSYGIQMKNLMVLPRQLIPLRGDFAPEQTRSREVSA